MPVSRHAPVVASSTFKNHADPKWFRRGVLAVFCLMALLVFWPAASRANTVAGYGPWNVSVMAGSVGFSHKLPADSPVLSAHADWSAYAWVHPRELPGDRQLIGGFGTPDGAARYFMVDDGRLSFWWGHGRVTDSRAALSAGAWQFLAAVVHDGKFHLYLNGHEVASTSAHTETVPAKLEIGPVGQPWPDAQHFGGRVAGFTVQAGALDLAALKEQAQKRRPTPKLTQYRLAGGHWPIQTHQMGGQVVPQPPATLPESRAPLSEPHAHKPGSHPAFAAQGEGRWVLDDWRLASATRLDNAEGAKLSRAEYAATDKAWMLATVPGTVLTTLVDRGVYPDPAYGLNNLAIPESLNKHDWWYRTRFKVPADLADRHLQLTFHGIDYAAEVWVNGTRVGNIVGAFVRGRFDVTKLLRAGRINAIAVRVSPPPHPGGPHEESLRSGPGPNGGMEALDGPTFIASESWDWIPSIRDRDTGLWQKVTLHATGAVRIGDPHVITHVPVPDLGRASVDIDVPLKNTGEQPVRGSLEAAFGDVQVERQVTVPPGGTVVRLRPSNAPQLNVQDPHLWWPNGYGEPYLYQLDLNFNTGTTVSDTQSLKFGIRQISYELSLFDDSGDLRRVLVTPERTDKPGQRLVDVSHKAIHRTQVPDADIWAYSLLPGAKRSPAIRKLKDERLSPYLAIRVNGVRIAIKGGSWGTDDFMKRVSRERLEPYFKLQKQAHFNVVRNWVGQSTESVFYQLADEYGMLVFNDFWQSTQDYNAEPMDDALFLRNAAEVIRRYRNHPSIVLWFGRNEGVPRPLLNKRLDALIAKLDGTRLYMPNSNHINLWKSGPYNYRPPRAYFTKLAKGFAVELGTPSFPTLEAFKAMMPKADRWPISDNWAYHDWHQSGNGDVHGFMAAMRTRFGKPTSLADFERKVQMMNYVNYRAIFEGLNAHLWTQNSGRLLWMSHPAWPSTTWQVYSHDYDTHGSYYGVKDASEPVHVQMNLPNHDFAVINNTTQVVKGDVDVSVYGLDGELLTHADCRIDAGPVAVTSVCGKIDVSRLIEARDVVFVTLQLHAANGDLLSRNFYWTADQPADLRRLNQLPTVDPQWKATQDAADHVRVHLANTSSDVALSIKLTLVDARGERILPAYYSDNYINLAPGVSRDIGISVEADARLRGAKVKLRGWNEASEARPIAGTE